MEPNAWIQMVSSQAPVVGVLGIIVWQLWSRLTERDKALGELLERYHQDAAKAAALLDKILTQLKK